MWVEITTHLFCCRVGELRAVSDSWLLKFRPSVHVIQSVVGLVIISLALIFFFGFFPLLYLSHLLSVLASRNLLLLLVTFSLFHTFLKTFNWLSNKFLNLPPKALMFKKNKTKILPSNSVSLHLIKNAFKCRSQKMVNNYGCSWKSLCSFVIICCHFWFCFLDSSFHQSVNGCLKFNEIQSWQKSVGSQIQQQSWAGDVHSFCVDKSVLGTCHVGFSQQHKHFTE